MNNVKVSNRRALKALRVGSALPHSVHEGELVEAQIQQVPQDHVAEEHSASRAPALRAPRREPTGAPPPEDAMRDARERDHRSGPEHQHQYRHVAQRTLLFFTMRLCRIQSHDKRW